jgi:hypothetical protein
VKEGPPRLRTKLGIGDVFKRRRVTAYRKKPARARCFLAIVSSLRPSRLTNRVIIVGRMSSNGILPTDRLKADRIAASATNRLPRLRLCRM